MKVKELIKILQILDPDDDVCFSLGRNQEYRTACAKAEIIEESCLYNLVIDEVVLETREGNLRSDIILEQDNYGKLSDLSEVSKEFDTIYTKE